MFDDHAGRLMEVFDALQRGVGIRHVVVGQFFALDLTRGSNACFSGIGLNIEGRLLVRVFAVAHFLHFVKLGVEGAGEFWRAVWHQGAKVVGNRTIVSGGVFIGLDRKIKTTLQAGAAAIGLHLAEDFAVIGGIHHDGDKRVVLGRCAHHGGPTDVDIFDGVFDGAVRVSNRCRKWVEVDHNHVNRIDAMRGHHVVILPPTAQNATVYFGV